MPAPEQIVFPAVLVLGIERVDPRTDDLVPFDGPNVVPEQVGPDTPDQRDPLELVVGGERRERRPIRISGRRESGIAACPALVEFDQLFIQMQILDHRTHLEVEPLSKHLVRPVLWPLLLIGQPTVQHRR